MGQAFTRTRKTKPEPSSLAPPPAPLPPPPPPQPLSVENQVRILMKEVPSTYQIPRNNRLGQLLIGLKRPRQQYANNSDSDSENNNTNETPVPMETFYSNAPLSVQEEFSSIKERLEKGETTVLKIYKMTSDYSFIQEINGIPVTSDPKLIDDLHSWSSDQKRNGYFLSDLTSLCDYKLRDMYLQGGLEQCSFLFLLFEAPMKIAGFAMIMSSVPYYSEDQDAIFLHSICAKKGKRYGEKLLLTLIEVAKRIPDKQTLRGEAVFSSVEFYKKYKFKVKQPCRGNYNDCVITYDLHTTGGTRKRRRGRKNKKTRKN